MTITNNFQDLLKANRRGLIAGPHETALAFSLRCAQHCHQEGVQRSEPISLPRLDMKLDWMEITYSNKGLHPWEGGCVWIEPEAPTKPRLQLRSCFKSQNHYLGYSYKEILEHEAVHLARTSFQETVFEEILAYQTARSYWRRFLGPLFATPQEALSCMATLTLLSCLPLLIPPAFLLFYSLIGLLVLGLLGRLSWRQFCFQRSRKQVSYCVGKRWALAVLLRLTDHEIRSFATWSQEKIRYYAYEQAENSLRWQQIYYAYFSKNKL